MKKLITPFFLFFFYYNLMGSNQPITLNNEENALYDRIISSFKRNNNHMLSGAIESFIHAEDHYNYANFGFIQVAPTKNVSIKEMLAVLNKKKALLQAEIAQEEIKRASNPRFQSYDPWSISGGISTILTAAYLFNRYAQKKSATQAPTAQFPGNNSWIPISYKSLIGLGLGLYTLGLYHTIQYSTYFSKREAEISTIDTIIKQIEEIKEHYSKRSKKLELNY